MDKGKIVKRVILKIVGIVIGILFCVFLLFIGKSGYDDVFKKKSNITHYQNRISAEIRRLTSMIESVQRTPQDLAYILAVQDVDLAEIKILLKSVLFNNEELFGSAVAFEPYQFQKDSVYFAPYLYRSGDTTTFTFLDDRTYDYFHKDWYLRPKAILKPIWSEPYYDEGGGNKLMSTYSVPFFKFDGYKEKYSGIVTVDVAIEWLTKAVEYIGMELHGSVVLVSENGTILTAPKESWISKETIYTLATKLNIPVLNDIGRDLQMGKSGIKLLEELPKEKSSAIFYETIKINKWGFILILPMDELYKSNPISKK